MMKFLICCFALSASHLAAAQGASRLSICTLSCKPSYILDAEKCRCVRDLENYPFAGERIDPSTLSDEALRKLILNAARSARTNEERRYLTSLAKQSRKIKNTVLGKDDGVKLEITAQQRTRTERTNIPDPVEKPITFPPSYEEERPTRCTKTCSLRRRCGPIPQTCEPEISCEAPTPCR
jgi:hypothetical protein